MRQYHRSGVATFEDSDQLYRVIGTLLERVSADPEMAEPLLKGDMVIRFNYRDPEATVTIDLRKQPISYSFGPNDLKADVEMRMSADTSHRFWSGRLNVAQAIATRKIVSRGSIAKALKLLPAIKPAFPLYVEVLRELGYQELIEDGKRRAGKSRSGHIRGGLRSLATAIRGKRKRRQRVSTATLERVGLPPLVSSERAALHDQETRALALPTDEADLKREMLARMLLIRAFEDTIATEYEAGNLPTEVIHVSTGQEAVAVGACFALRGDDGLTTTHRGHGHMLAKGADLDGMIAEIFGKATGLCGGKGGSLHVTDSSVAALGANGIVGASILIGAGAALTARRKDTDRVALAFCGDGATNQGMFHEGLNLAAVWDLPLVVVVENNLYGEFTPLEEHTRVHRLAERAAAYGIPGVTVDGNDPLSVYSAVTEAVGRARTGQGPTMIEAETYRWHGHMEGETAQYRSSEEIAEWKKRDPIELFQRQLLDEGLLDEGHASDLADDVRSRVEQAVESARKADNPPPASFGNDVFSPDDKVLYERHGTNGEEPDSPAPKLETVTVSRAIYEALAEEMERDERVFLLGEDVTTGGYFAVTDDLAERFPDRVLDTPISEYAIVGAAVGAAMTGLRPVAEILFSDFLTCCFDPLVNQAAKLRYMSGGQYSIPLVVRTPGGGGIGAAAQHSQSLEALMTGIPGLLVVAPGDATGAKGLLKAAIRSNNPVLFFENKLGYVDSGEIPAGDCLEPLGVSAVKRRGEDLTIVSIGAILGRVLEAAALLADEGLEVEVVDLRSLVPLDLPTLTKSVDSTGRLLVVEDGCLMHGFGAEIIARLTETLYGSLKAPPRRLAGADTERIAASARGLCDTRV